MIPASVIASTGLHSQMKGVGGGVGVYAVLCGCAKVLTEVSLEGAE